MRFPSFPVGAALAVLCGGAAAQSLDAALLTRLNEARTRGVRCPDGARPAQAALTFSPELAASARQQAQYMAASGRITHVGADGSNPRVRAASFGTKASSVSEIIYLNVAGPVDRAVTWWIGSTVHCDVLTHPRYTKAGASVVRGPRGTAFVVVLSN